MTLLLVVGCGTIDPQDRAYVRSANAAMAVRPPSEASSPTQRVNNELFERAVGIHPQDIPPGARYEYPRLVKMVPPDYPPVANQKRKTGEVSLALWVNEKGRVAEAKVVSSTDPVFEPAALAAVRKWRYAPAKIDGRAIASSFLVPIRFRLE